MKMKIAGSRIADIGELLREIEEELANKDSFDMTNQYERGQHDELRWVRNKLRSLPEVEVRSVYDETFGEDTRP